MRRSVREAIVGFSIVGAIAAFAGTMLWMRGIRLGAETWTVTVRFDDAGGLDARSPVTYRGILVGSGPIDQRHPAGGGGHARDQ